MIINLKLLQSAMGEPDAWFIPGSSGEHWLDELARCSLATLDTRLYALTSGVRSNEVAGVLVVPGSKIAQPTPAGLPFKRLGARLFIPADADLVPPASDAELNRLCPYHVVVFHPAFGVQAFTAADELRISQLVAPLPQQPQNWNFAVAGPAPMPQLKGVFLAQPPSAQELFGDASQQIGTESPDELPPAPDEPQANPAAASGRKLKRMFMQGLENILKKLPHTGSSHTWVNDAENWVDRQMRQIDQQLEQLRNKELHRLLKLLETNPEAGLRHALPMNSFAHRGIAPPAGRLGSHPLNFDPHNLGGRPADFWNVPLDLQEVLRRRYREMADREMQLGRYRRAAYIYAELLGDLVSAAHTLKKGQHFREAAILYDEHLHNPLEAAHCLKEGGLLQEAIERYEKLNRWLDVAELQERLGNLAAAQAAVRRVIDERLTQNDFLGAAKLAEERLHSPDEAVTFLHEAWPDSRQAAASVGALLALFARYGKHDHAISRALRFSREPIPPALSASLLNALSIPARTYPDKQVQQQLADFSRILISRELKRPGISLEDATRMTDHLIHLATEDRLLARDANRFLDMKRTADMRARFALPPPQSGTVPTLYRRFDLPRQIQWLQLRKESYWFFALGVTPRRLTIVRGVWDGDYQSLSWECPGVAIKSGFVFEPTAELGRNLAVARADGAPLETKSFPATDIFFGQECIVGTPSWLPKQGFPFAFGEENVLSSQIASGQVIVSVHDKQGRLLSTLDTTHDLLEGATRTNDTHLCLAALPGTVAIALGNRLVLTRPDGGFTRVELPGQVTQLIATLPHTRRGLIVILDHGAVMHWIGSGTLIELESDLPSPLATFVPGGPLVLVSGHNCVLLDVDARGVHSVTRFELEGQRPVGVTATASTGQFAVLGVAGEVTVYRIPRS